ncbi:uncharacterized protein LOC126733833 [Anthonomus grandis grandis]|uniref:uncharacterized protein LOC126733833 n=1 Tax=Anthonomus grandis grandis TaxID=2921223 RepID=UPI002165C93B|nr:uncharacterized protein LOC126733833 [Anthonomus grandis grandis]
MPSFCSVVKCLMRAERDNVKFFRIPAALKDRGDILDALSNERRDLWIKSLKRGPFTDTFLKNARICSRHFINGAPAELEDKGNPDWVPNQNMGYVTIKTVTKKAVERHDRALNRRKRVKLEINAEESKTGIDPGINPENVNTPSCSNTQMENMNEEIAATKVSETQTSIAVQTDLLIDNLCKLFADLKFCNSQIYKLKQRLESCDLNEDSFKNNGSKCLYFTGLSCNIFFTLYEDIKPFLSVKKALSPFQQLLLTLMKFRLNLPFKYMSYRLNNCFRDLLKYFKYLILKTETFCFGAISRPVTQKCSCLF